MKLRCRIVFLIASTLPVVAASRCRTIQTGNVHHVVVCWLKQPGDRNARRRLVRVSREFVSVPGVVRVNAGTVLPSRRKIVDSTFDVALVITFKDTEALQRYLANPRHKKAVRDHLKPLTRKVVVYDFVERPTR